MGFRVRASKLIFPWKVAHRLAPAMAAARGVPLKLMRLENCTYQASRAEALLGKHATPIANLQRFARTMLIIKNIE